MALGPRLDLRQSQSLVMTPQLQQAIKLLALSNLEIEAFIGETASDGSGLTWPQPVDPALGIDGSRLKNAFHLANRRLADEVAAAVDLRGMATTASTVLLKDDSGLMTSIFKFAPGATMTDHEHVGIEQTYLLDGHLVDKEGPAAGLEVKKGEFVWREPGSQHSAWSPNSRPGPSTPFPIPRATSRRTSTIRAIMTRTARSSCCWAQAICRGRASPFTSPRPWPDWAWWPACNRPSTPRGERPASSTSAGWVCAGPPR